MSGAEVKKFFTETCCVCLIETTTHYFHPCGHKNICKSCTLQNLDNRDSATYQKCPTCHMKYDDIIRFDIKYRYNPVSMSTLEDAKIHVNIPSGFDNIVSDPVVEQRLIRENKVVWNLGNTNATKSKGIIVDQFDLDDEPTEYGSISAEFKSVDKSLSGVQFRPDTDFPIGDVVMRIFAGKYTCGEETSD